jgi:hypothetical protein
MMILTITVIAFLLWLIGPFHDRDNHDPHHYA